MSTELAIHQPQQQMTVSNIPPAARGLVEWAESASAAYELARRLVGTAFAPAQYKGKPEEAAAAMLAGADVGLSPMASLRAFDVIQGTAAPRAITYRAILLSMGHKLNYPTMTPTRVVVRGLRMGDTEWQTVEWTIKRAQDLGLTNKEQWKKQPQTMLIARATAEIARLIAADAILGIPYSIEEIMDSEPESTTTVTRLPAATRSVRRTPTKVEPVEPPLDETPEPTLEPEPEQAPVDVTAHLEAITKPQLTKMHILFKERGIEDRTDALNFLAGLGYEVESSKDLTKDAASHVIEALERMDPA
jgi:hypothetical protein